MAPNHNSWIRETIFDIIDNNRSTVSLLHLPNSRSCVGVEEWTNFRFIFKWAFLSINYIKHSQIDRTLSNGSVGWEVRGPYIKSTREKHRNNSTLHFAKLFLIAIESTSHTYMSVSSFFGGCCCYQYTTTTTTNVMDAVNVVGVPRLLSCSPDHGCGYMRLGHRAGIGGKQRFAIYYYALHVLIVIVYGRTI